jgi:hypothetical protein
MQSGNLARRTEIVALLSSRMTMKSLAAGLLLSASAGFAATYHVDSAGGDDANSGTAPGQAWKSLDRVNQTTFQPGDQLLFKAGTRHTGQLKPQGSGRMTAGKLEPIVIGQYGAGPRPRLDGEGQVLDTLLLRNVEFWEVRDLEITNLGANRAPWRTGVRIVTDGFGKMRHIRLTNLFVHDVNGHLSKNREGCGIFFESRGGNGSHFDGLVVENCHLLRTDRNGICQRGGGGERSLGVVIRGNLLEDIGGDCIKPWGSNGALVERNVVRGGRTRCDDYAAGIWPFDSDDTIIQFNDVSGIKGTKDGQAFDSDYRCRRSIFQYNYSHDNEGGFMLICSPGTSYNEGTVIRYNVSQNDGLDTARVFHISGVSNTWIYNNVVYLGPKQNLPLLLFNEWDRGSARDTRFFNNIFYVEGRATIEWGKSAGNVFSNNVFYGNIVGVPAGSLTNRPPLARPGSGKDGLDSLTGYKLEREFERGLILPNNGGRDFFGNAVPADKPPCIGVFETR